MRIAICDDDDYIVESLYAKVKNILDACNYNYELCCFKTGTDMMIDIETRGIYDVILLDIALGRENGVDIARKLREEYKIFSLIFISQYQEYYRDVFEVDAKWFLDKPFNEERLKKALEKAINDICFADDVLEFYFKKSIYRIKFRDIMYIESDKRKLVIYCSDNRTYEYYGKLSKIQEEINGGSVRFIRINQSYLINPEGIKRYSYNDVELYNGKNISISKSKREYVREIFMGTKI